MTLRMKVWISLLPYATALQARPARFGWAKPPATLGNARPLKGRRERARGGTRLLRCHGRTRCEIIRVARHDPLNESQLKVGARRASVLAGLSIKPRLAIKPAWPLRGAWLSTADSLFKVVRPHKKVCYLNTSGLVTLDVTPPTMGLFSALSTQRAIIG